MNIDLLMGLQYGSEGKGFVSALLAKQGKYDGFVRSGGPNAGHCLLHHGREYKMRMIPCGWVDPNAELFIGPAAVINPEVLAEEIAMVEDAGYSVRERLHIHPNAAIITQEHMDEEMAALRGAIGSTAEGVGACRRGKMSRLDGNYLLASNADMPCRVEKSPDDWYAKLMKCENVLLEGTQGAGLCITHGQFPFVTSWPCTAAQLLSDAGLPIANVRHIIGVVRTKPIRVAGNSGPLEGETTFQELGQPEEHTTVTKKVRRVAKGIDWVQLDRNIAINRPTVIALTFGDYLTDKELAELIATIENRYRIPVGYVGMGKEGQHLAAAVPFTTVTSHDLNDDVEDTLNLVLARVKTMLLDKRSKYGTENINEGGEVGIFYRAWDKIYRLKHQLIDATATIDDEDPWLDLVGYGLIQLVRRIRGRW